MHRHLMPGTHRIAAACAALFLAAVGGGGAAYASISAGRRVDLVAAADTCVGHCDEASSCSPLGDRRSRGGALAVDALHDRVDTIVAIRADRLALVLYKKKVKKKVEALRGPVVRLPDRATRIPILGVDPQKVSWQAQPAIPLIRTVVLLV